MLPQAWTQLQVDHHRSSEYHKLRPTMIAALLSLTVLGNPCLGQQQDRTSPQPVRPQYKWYVEAPLVLTGGGLRLLANSITVTTQVVPPQGLDPNDIHWSVDRKSLSTMSVKADNDSDYFRAAATAYPMLLALVSQSSGTNLTGTLWRSLEYAEAIAVSQGITRTLKNSISRPRPFTYVPTSERPTDAPYDVTSREAFRSMPSGHAVIGFTASGFAMTDHLLTRPNASWPEQVGVSALGGFLAGMTSSLRVEGGQHFPTDTFVGAFIGTASGVGVPLLHRYIAKDGSRAPMPSASAWLQALAGQLIGVGIGVVGSHLLY